LINNLNFIYYAGDWTAKVAPNHTNFITNVNLTIEILKRKSFFLLE